MISKKKTPSKEDKKAPNQLWGISPVNYCGEVVVRNKHGDAEITKYLMPGDILYLEGPPISIKGSDKLQLECICLPWSGNTTTEKKAPKKTTKKAVKKTAKKHLRKTRH